MKQKFLDRNILILLASFVISRIVLSWSKVEMNTDSINVYWQYLSVDSLQNNLLKGVWYNHTQPPVFNLFLGGILKLFGDRAAFIFPFIFKLITIINVVVLYKCLNMLVSEARISLVLSLVYLLSPATMILENELFYTTFITMLLLLSSYNLLHFKSKQSYLHAWGFLLPLAIACLTRSMYNIIWLFVIAVVVIIYFRKTAFKTLAVVSVFCILLTASWYIKNYLIFEKFTTSTWLGMNLARNVFHDQVSVDSSRIEAIEPFSKISVYKPFIAGRLEEKYAGLNDKELLNEFKNGGHVNENHINYIEVSEKYAEASKKYVMSHPAAYIKNVLQSAIIFFVPATRYPLAEEQSRKIKYYDLIYSFNLSHFAKGKEERRIAMVISAIPKIILYVFTFSFILIGVKRNRQISVLNLFIVLTFLYVFVISSCMEHYENMRFRFEIEPLFLLLVAQVIATKFKQKADVSEGALKK
jgi:hypothetical protein